MQAYQLFITAALFWQFLLDEVHGYELCIGTTVDEECEGWFQKSCPPGYNEPIYVDVPGDIPRCVCTRNLTPEEWKDREDCRCREFVRQCDNGSPNDYTCYQAVRDCPAEMKAKLCSGEKEYSRYDIYCPETPGTPTPLDDCIQKRTLDCVDQSLKNLTDPTSPEECLYLIIKTKCEEQLFGNPLDLLYDMSNFLTEDDQFKEAFYQIDSNRNGYIVFQEFKEYLIRDGEFFTDANIRQKFDFFDGDHSGTISLSEYLKVLGILS